MATNSKSNGANHNPAFVSHLYVHIPFCARICPYCAFYKEQTDRSYAQRFCEAILGELDQWKSRVCLIPQTIFVGGGTPTALTIAQLRYLIEGFHDRLDLSLVREWTVEANPGSVSPRKAAILHELGVNRISLGVQSWDDQLLKLLGREHDAVQAVTSYRVLRRAGFKNINIDLMFGLPGQTLAQWKETLRKTIALEPQHISTYCLTYEEDTEFFLKRARGEFREDSDSDAIFLETAMEILERAGFEHYEISNYARDGYTSIHNHGYWAGEDYVGLGPGAFSTVGLKRFQSVANYRTYTDEVLAGRPAISATENLTAAIKKSERIALGLRTRRGIPSEELDHWPNERREFQELGFFREVDGHQVLTEKGKLLADSIAEAFVEGVTPEELQPWKD